MTSNPYIYTSEKVRPYVYVCTHKKTGEYYFGYRSGNTHPNINRPSHLDFPLYRTSSKIVKPEFEKYEWIILAEFYEAEYARQFEQELINEHINNRLCLNDTKDEWFICDNRPHLKQKRKDKEYDLKVKSFNNYVALNLSNSIFSESVTTNIYKEMPYEQDVDYIDAGSHGEPLIND